MSVMSQMSQVENGQAGREEVREEMMHDIARKHNK